MARWERPLAGQAADDNDATQAMHPSAPASDQDGPVERTAAALQAWLTHSLACHLGLAAGALRVDLPFAYHGLDSLTAVQLSEALSRGLGRPLSPTHLPLRTHAPLDDRCAR